LSWSTALIDFRPKKLVRSTSFWCPTRSGQRVTNNKV
jgi:hypothetical protein